MKIYPYLIKTNYVKFKNKSDGKTRPILLHRLNNKMIKAWSVTTKYLTKSSFIRLQYFPLFKWHPYGLNRTSYIDIKSEINIPERIYEALNLCKRDPIWHLDYEDINSFIDFYHSYNYRLKKWRSHKNKHS